MKDDHPTQAASSDAGSVAAAMDALVRGYEEEAQLYQRMRRLTWRQRETLSDGWNLDRFRDLLDEKQDLLRMIGEIESHLRRAKALVLAHKPAQCPGRWKLETLLDGLTATIEEIRILEGANALLLHAVTAQPIQRSAQVPAVSSQLSAIS